MDWATVTSTAITGLVGLAGIGGTLWQTRKSREAASKDLKESLDAASRNLVMSISADNERFRETEKRRLYAASLTAFNEMMSAAIEYATQPDGKRETAASRLASAHEGMNRTLEELMLIAPKSVGVLAVNLSNFFVDFIRTLETQPNNRPNAKLGGLMRTELVRAMRNDLGEDNWAPERQQLRDGAAGGTASIP